MRLTLFLTKRRIRGGLEVIVVTDQWLIRALFVALTTLVSGLLATRLLRRRVSSRRAKERSKRAQRGEMHAERLLRKAGFRIEGRQVPKTVTIMIDGVPAEYSLRADFVCRKKKLRFVAEAKTGSVAPSVHHRPTRRQLLEYRYAFDVDGVLLVDAETDVVHHIVFPMINSR